MEANVSLHGKEILCDGTVGVEDSQSGLEPGKLKSGPAACAKLRDEVVMNLFRVRFVSSKGTRKIFHDMGSQSLHSTHCGCIFHADLRTLYCYWWAFQSRLQTPPLYSKWLLDGRLEEDLRKT
jgi:hypothetical protein